MDEDRVEELMDLMIDASRLNHEVSVDKWQRELKDVFVKQQEQLQLYEDSLRHIADTTPKTPVPSRISGYYQNIAETTLRNSR